MQQLAPTTFDKLVITWNACCVQMMWPPQTVLGDKFTYQRLRHQVYICWNPESREPANHWWKALNLRDAPTINGDIVLMRLHDAFTVADLCTQGHSIFSCKFDPHFLDYQIV